MNTYRLTSPMGSSDCSVATSTPPSMMSAESATSTAFPSFTDLTKALEQAEQAQLDLQDIKHFLIKLAKRAGRMMMHADPSIDSSLEKNNSSDRVTETDRAIETMVRCELATRYPTLLFLGEETCHEGQKLSDRPTFVCDPIDGTLNFIHGFPNYAISLALTISKEPVVGVVYNPARNDLFSAVKGRGAEYVPWHGGKARSLPLRPVAEPIDGLGSCLVAMEWGNDRLSPNWRTRLHTHAALLSHPDFDGNNGGAMAHSVRSSGSAALDLCYVAAGWHDVFWEGGCWIWDVAAGWLVVKEAGGIVAGANPGEWDPSLEGRSYLAVRGAASGQREVVEQLWRLMGPHRFEFEGVD
jgi:myo-inositol-1(or 4)-monophosphatase